MPATDMAVTDSLIHVSTPLLLLSTVPLFIHAFISSQMGLGLGSPIVVGVIRTFVQLTILGAILRPIFVWGIELWWLVLLYCLFMIMLASLEASARSRYYFQGMFYCILAAFLANISLVSIFAFGVIIRPQPLWDPQYVIPIVGMLLGNCINAVALSMNAIITSLVEQSQEIELLLSFGASPEEASARLMKEAVRVGAMPMLNSMVVIGLISIPGMMTGQILGGAPAMEAARYQMLICYLIGMCAFGTILAEVFVVRTIAFDQQTQMLTTNRFIKRKTKLSLFGRIAAGYSILKRATSRVHDNDNGSMNEREALSANHAMDLEYVAPKGTLELLTVQRANNVQQQQRASTTTPNLEIRQVSRSFPENDGVVGRTLFSDVSKTIAAGDIVAVRGASGVGKSQLLRLVAGLSPIDSGGDLLLEGMSRSEFKNPAQWRRQVRYVSQSKVDITGTPRMFIQRVSSLHSWQRHDMPSFTEMIASTQSLLQSW